MEGVLRDPSKWWDYRNNKQIHSPLDFKHEADKCRNPYLVSGELRSQAFIAEPCQGTLYQLPSCATVEENRKMDSLHKRSWVDGELRSQGFVREPGHDTLNQLRSVVLVEDDYKMDSLCDPPLVSAELRRQEFIGAPFQGSLLLPSHREADEDHKISKKFLSIPSKWWYDCSRKPTPRHADFKHKVSGKPLWTDSWGNPPRINEELRNQGLLGEPCHDTLSTTQIGFFVASLRACTLSKDLARGTRIHHDLVQRRLVGKCFDALVTMYAKCGELGKAKSLLDSHKSKDVITWTALIAGYAREGRAQSALDCLEQMQREGVLPDAVTYASALKACATIKAADRGKQIHDEIARQGFLQHNIVVGGALVDMYAKCGDVSEARRVHEELPARNVISWSALVAGYAQEGKAEQALNCLEQMRREGILPNAVTYVSALKACATIRATDMGKQMHDEIVWQGLLQNNLVLGNALVDMYAKCGDLAEARRVLEELPSRNVVSWNTLIAGYAHEGEAKQALNCVEQMQHEGILPDAVTCACVLNVCSHLGLVEEGQALFESMSTKFGVKPSLECYTCMIDLIGRAGHLEKAVRLIQGMPSSDYMALWHAFMGACQKWADVKVGRWAYEQAVELDESEGATYVLMANIYAEAGMEEEAKSMEALRIKNKAWKKPGCSWWIDSLSKVVHKFGVADTKHAQHTWIDAKLEDLSHKMSQQGHSRGLRRMSQTILSSAKTHLSCRHSEQLALACALINTPQGETVHITKNMRMCGDCHVVTSLISRIEMRRIVVTDANFCHRFEDGMCSCNDYV